MISGLAEDFSFILQEKTLQQLYLEGKILHNSFPI